MSKSREEHLWEIYKILIQANPTHCYQRNFEYFLKISNLAVETFEKGVNKELPIDGARACHQL